jgi:hypothetical protein
MRRDLNNGDSVTVTLGGVTHEFPADRVRVSVDDTRAAGKVTRFATIVVTLADEFPEDVSKHLSRIREG